MLSKLLKKLEAQGKAIVGSSLIEAVTKRVENCDSKHSVRPELVEGSKN